MTIKKNHAAPDIAVTGAAGKRRGSACPSFSVFNFSTHPAARQDIFAGIRERITPREAAEFYGFSPNHAGFICCPFHNEKTPSLKLYPDSWYCFGCKRGGSVIDFAMNLFDLPPLEAARRLDADFMLGLCGNIPPPQIRRQAAERQHIRAVSDAYSGWRKAALQALAETIGIGFDALEHRLPEQWNAAETEAIRYRQWLESVYDDLDSDDTERQLKIFRMRREIQEVCGRILQTMN